MKRIAAEEAFATPDLLAAYRRLLEHPPDDLDPGFRNLVGYYLTNQHPRALLMSTRIQDIGERRPGYADYVRRTNAFVPGRPRP